jgi:hypothetical protein
VHAKNTIERSKKAAEWLVEEHERNRGFEERILMQKD